MMIIMMVIAENPAGFAIVMMPMRVVSQVTRKSAAMALIKIAMGKTPVAMTMILILMTMGMDSLTMMMAMAIATMVPCVIVTMLTVPSIRVRLTFAVTE